MNHNTVHDEHSILRWIQFFVLLVIAVVVAVYASRTGRPVIVLGVLSIPVLLALLGRPDLLLLGIFMGGISSLSIPGMQLDLQNAMSLLAAGIGTLSFIMGRHRFALLPERRWMLVFVMVVMLLIFVRGTGLRILGGADWGGAMYILFISSIIFNFVYDDVVIRSDQIRKLLLWMIPVVLASAIIKRMGYMQGLEDMEGVGSFSSVTRLNWPGPLGSFLIVISYVWFSHGGLRRWACWFAGLGIVALSGFRGRTLTVFAVLLIFEFFRSKKKSRFALHTLMFGTVIYVVVFAIVPLLPLGIQRSLSLLPGMEARLTHQAVISADNSSQWRLLIWEYCWERLPQYLFIGRGLAINVFEALASMSVMDIASRSQWHMYTLHNYHSGPIFLLMDLGIPGFIAFLGIQVSMLVVVLRWFLRRKARTRTFLETFTYYLSASFVWSCVSFYAVFGDAETVASTLLSVGILRVLYRSVEREDASLSAEGAVISGQRAPETQKSALGRGYLR